MIFEFRADSAAYAGLSVREEWKAVELPWLRGVPSRRPDGVALSASYYSVNVKQSALFRDARSAAAKEKTAPLRLYGLALSGAHWTAVTSEESADSFLIQSLERRYDGSRESLTAGEKAGEASPGALAYEIRAARAAVTIIHEDSSRTELVIGETREDDASFASDEGGESRGDETEKGASSRLSLFDAGGDTLPQFGTRAANFRVGELNWESGSGLLMGIGGELFMTSQGEGKTQTSSFPGFYLRRDSKRKSLTLQDRVFLRGDSSIEAVVPFSDQSVLAVRTESGSGTDVVEILREIEDGRTRVIKSYRGFLTALFDGHVTMTIRGAEGDDSLLGEGSADRLTTIRLHGNAAAAALREKARVAPTVAQRWLETQGRDGEIREKQKPAETPEARIEKDEEEEEMENIARRRQILSLSGESFSKLRWTLHGAAFHYRRTAGKEERAEETEGGFEPSPAYAAASKGFFGYAAPAAGPKPSFFSEQPGSASIDPKGGRPGGRGAVEMIQRTLEGFPLAFRMESALEPSGKEAGPKT